MIDHDEGIGVFCPGCTVELTINNAGGYRNYCVTCVEAMPASFPDAPPGTGFQLEGRYPHFRWVAEESRTTDADK